MLSQKEKVNTCPGFVLQRAFEERHLGLERGPPSSFLEALSPPAPPRLCAVSGGTRLSLHLRASAGTRCPKAAENLRAQKGISSA